MRILTNTLSIVILADWNKLFLQPDWVAKNIFEKSEMEIGVETQGVECKISYICNGVIINPTQDKVVLTAMALDRCTVESLAQCAKNYFTKTASPYLFAWGVNIDYNESDGRLLADIFDSLSDSGVYINLGYNVTSTQLERTIEKDGRNINVQYYLKPSQTTIRFNEHHNNPNENDRDIGGDYFFGFIERTKEIVMALGYELEEEDE